MGQTLSLDGYPEFSDAGRNRLRDPHDPPEVVVGRTLATRAVSRGLVRVCGHLTTRTTRQRSSYVPPIKQDIKEELP